MSTKPDKSSYPSKETGASPLILFALNLSIVTHYTTSTVVQNLTQTVTN